MNELCQMLIQLLEAELGVVVNPLTSNPGERSLMIAHAHDYELPVSFLIVFPDVLRLTNHSAPFIAQYELAAPDALPRLLADLRRILGQ